MKTLKLTVFAIVVLFYGFLNSSNAQWVQVNNGIGNNQPVVPLAANVNTIFAGTANPANGVYLSTNNSSSWTQRNEGLGGSLTIFSLCIFYNYIFAGTADGVYRRPIGELTGIQPISGQLPSHFDLEQNYPNPFNPTTNVKFQIPRLRNGQANEGFVKLIVFDVLDREAATLKNEQLKPGTYEVNWNASNYTSGVYYYRIAIHSDKLTSSEFSETKKMILIK